MTHTPGPWEVGGGNNGGEPGYVYCDNSLGSAVAIVYGKPLALSVFSDDEEKANARLIAAAPEMLDALRAARAVLESLDHPTNGLDGLTFRHSGGPIGAIIDAAMAKATGSDPAMTSAEGTEP